MDPFRFNRFFSFFPCADVLLLVVEEGLVARNVKSVVAASTIIICSDICVIDIQFITCVVVIRIVCVVIICAVIVFVFFIIVIIIISSILILIIIIIILTMPAPRGDCRLRCAQMRNVR